MDAPFFLALTILTALGLVSYITLIKSSGRSARARVFRLTDRAFFSATARFEGWPVGLAALHVDFLARQSVAMERVRSMPRYDLATIGLVIEAAVEKPRGEELRSIGSELIEPVAATSMALEQAVLQGQPATAYDALATYSELWITRNAAAADRTLLEMKNLIRFVEDVRVCREHIDNREFAGARFIMRHWYTAWRHWDISHDNAVLPRDALPVALLCHEVILALYADSLEMLSSKHVDETRQLTVRLLDWSVRVLEGEESFSARAFFDAEGLAHRVPKHRSASAKAVSQESVLPRVPDGRVRHGRLRPGWETILRDGFDVEARTWSVHTLWATNAHSFDYLLPEIRMIGTRSDVVCGIRASGIAMAATIAQCERSPLLWFRDSSVSALFPRYHDVRGLTVTLCDSHARTGLNLQRHTAILHALGAKVSRAVVIFDVDLEQTFGSANGDMAADGHVSRRAHQLSDLLSPYRADVLAIWRWSDVMEELRLSDDPALQHIYHTYLSVGDAFWA